jgi:predicted acetyltransferase
MGAPCQVSELRPADTAQMLKLRNSIFGHISRDHWDAMDCTAAVARRGKKLYGAVPLQRRTFALDGSCSIPVVFENAVGVSKEVRSAGLGTAMIEAADRFMADRVDALFVYRTGERSDGYRFYRKTHHGDLYFADTLTLARPRGRRRGVQVVDWAESAALEKRLLPLFRKCYGRFGGYWQRSAGFYQQIVNSHVYKNDECRLFLAGAGSRISGYAITNPRSMIWGGMCIYDFAAPTDATRTALLEMIEYTARRAGLPVTMPCNREHPLTAKLLDRGYVVSNHSPYIMARIVRPDRIFARLARGSTVARRLRLEVQTPHRDFVLSSPRRPAATVRLLLKESQLSRLMCRRMHLRTALQTNLIRSTPMEPRVELALDRVFRPAPWVTFGVDYA